MALKSVRRSRQGLRIVGFLVALILIVILIGAAYTTYRINHFSQRVFSEEQSVPLLPDETQTPIVASPSPQSTVVQAHALPGEPTSVEVSRPTDSPTPTPKPTLLPYGSVPLTQRLEAGKPLNVLLLGLAGPEHDGPYLTDSLQLLHYEPDTGVATLISLPRDLWVFVPKVADRGGAWNKINQAYQIGMGKVGRNDLNIPYAKHAQGGQLVSKVVAQVLDMPVDAWISLDFKGFRQFIDALGGVEVDVQRTFTDDHYPANDDEAVDASYTTIHFNAGCQYMDGERALSFARSRYAPEDGSDFGRARRQQLLLGAVERKIFRVSTIPRAFSLLGALEDHLHTSLSQRETQDLVGWLQAEANKERRITIQSGGITGNLVFESTSANGAYILLPKLGQGKYSAIQSYARKLIAGTATATPTATSTTRPSSRPSPTPENVLPEATVVAEPCGS